MRPSLRHEMCGQSAQRIITRDSCYTARCIPSSRRKQFKVGVQADVTQISPEIYRFRVKYCAGKNISVLARTDRAAPGKRFRQQGQRPIQVRILETLAEPVL